MTNAPVLYISNKCRPVSPCLILKARKKAMTTIMISKMRKSACLSQLGDFFLYKTIAPFFGTVYPDTISLSGSAFEKVQCYIITYNPSSVESYLSEVLSSVKYSPAECRYKSLYASHLLNFPTIFFPSPKALVFIFANSGALL